MITGYGAVTNAAQMPGATAVVIGAGGVGLNAVQGAALSGAARLIAVYLSDEKLAAARAFGATDGLRGDDPALVETVRRLAPGSADYVFVAVGATGAMAQAYEMLAVGGAAVLVGMPPLGHTDLRSAHAGGSAQRIIGSKMGQATPSVDIPALEALYLDGRLKLDG